MIRVHTLGTALIDVGTCSIKPTSPRKFALLLHLSAERGRRIPRTSLQELIFSDQTERNGRHSLREIVYQLRQFGAELDTSPEGVELVASQVQADYDRVLASETGAPEYLHAAAGGFLPGYAPTHSEAFSEWYEGFRARSISAISRAFLKEVNRGRNTGEWEATERAARACLALDPLNEEATLALAEMLALGGAKAKAVKLLDAYMGEVGRISPEIRLPARILRRRIDQVPNAGPSRFTPRFVGRSNEMGELRNVLRQTWRSEAHCVVLSGEPGIGKSRLLTEFRSIAELDGVHCERVTMQPHDFNRPMGAFVDLVPMLLQLPGALGCTPESMEALRRLVGSAPNSPEPKVRIEIEAAAVALTTAIGDLCEAIAAEVPLVLIIEDVHSLDEFSILTLSALISSRHRSRVLALVTTREPRPLLRVVRHSDRVHHLHLAPLAAQATNTLIEDLLSSSAIPVTPYVRSRLADVANGNPLFAVLLAAHYRETGDSGGIPPTLLESLTRRLDPLPRIALSVLTTCIALGKHCTTDRLLRALEITPIALLETVADLTDLGLLDSRTDYIAAAHPLIAEAVAKQALPSIRSTVNFRVAEVFEHDARALGSPALWWETATRWRDAGEADRAIAAFRECAEHAMQIGRASEAARMLDAALRLPVSTESRAIAARELVIAADLSSDAELVLLGQQMLRSERRHTLHDELELAERRAFLRSAKLPDGLLEMTRECLRAADASAEHRVEAATLALKCAEIFGTGQKTVELIERDLPSPVVATAGRLVQLEFELLLRSAKEDREGAADVALQLCDEIQRHPLIASITPAMNCGIALFLAGRIQAAITVFEGAYQRALHARSIGHQLRIALVLGSLYNDIHDEKNWDIWLSRATDLAIQNPDVAQNFDLIIMRIMRAFAAGDLMSVEYLVNEADEGGVFCEGTARQRWGRAVSLLLGVKKGNIGPEGEDIARSLFRDRVNSMHGYRDVEVAAAALLLGRYDRREASLRIRAYLQTERTTLRPVARLLTDIVDQLENTAL